MDQYGGQPNGGDVRSGDSDAFWRGDLQPEQPTPWHSSTTGASSDWTLHQQTPARPQTQQPLVATAAATRPRLGRKALASLVLGTALLTGVASSAGTYALISRDQPAAVSASTSPQPVSVKDVTRTTSSWTKVAATASKSVVAITTSDGAGSGVIWDEQGHIVTNNHVIAGSQQVGITFSDGRTATASVVGTDASTDLAVLKLEDSADGLTPIARATTTPAVGDDVMAIGNPLGLSGTATTGIVSAMNRPLSTSESGSQTGGSTTAVVSAIQTSAAINPGNSGGALINSAGELIGITNAIASLGSNQQGQSGNIGIGFAIPVSEVTRISQDLLDHGTASHGYLGVSVRATTSSDSTQAADHQGAQIAAVDASGPSHRALQVGDVVTKVNDVAVVSSESLIALTRVEAPGTTVTLTVMRKGSTEQVPVKLGSAPE